MRAAATDDEQAEPKEHPLKGDVLPGFVNQESQRARDGHISRADEKVGQDVQPTPRAGCRGNNGCGA